MIDLQQVRIIIKKDGSIEILYQGFQGEQCFIEAQRIYNQLKALGVNVEIKQIKKTQEYYTREGEKIEQR